MFACDGCKNSVPNSGKIWCSAQKMMIAVSRVNGEHVANCTFFDQK